jgi:hypothetical protein
VMQRFLRIRHGAQFREFHIFGHSWGCYKSRPDGQGWDYNCPTNGRRYVDVAAGRRW